MWLYCLKSVRDTVDISETRRSPVEVGSLSTTIYKVLPNHPTPVVVYFFQPATVLLQGFLGQTPGGGVNIPQP